MNRFLLAFTFTLGFFAPAHAQEGQYQAKDAALLQNCIETVRDINSDPENETNANTRECIGVAAKACMEESNENTTTFGMVTCTQREASWWDEYLNTLYTDLRGAIGEEEFDKLRISQRAWVSFRDATCEFEYFYWREGTIRSVIGADCLLQITAERALDLGEFIEWASL